MVQGFIDNSGFPVGGSQSSHPPLYFKENLVLFLATIIHHHHDPSGSWYQQYVELLRNPAHWLFELTLMVVVDLLLLAIVWPRIQSWIKRHDKEVHGSG